MGSQLLWITPGFLLAPVQISQSRVLLKAGRLKETVLTSAPSTVPGPLIIWAQQGCFGVALFFPSLFFCWDKGCKHPSFLIQVHSQGWVRLVGAWAQSTLQSFREPRLVGRMLLGESGCNRSKAGSKREGTFQQSRWDWTGRRGKAGCGNVTLAFRTREDQGVEYAVWCGVD